MVTRTWSPWTGMLVLAACHTDPTSPSVDASSTGSRDETTTGSDETAGTPTTGMTTAASTTTTGEPPAATLSEVDCHGHDGLELAAAPGSDLGGLGIVIDGVADYVLPPGSLTNDAGLLVVREGDATTPGLDADVACSDAEIELVRDGEILDVLALPSFPGSFKGTTWCSVSEEPFALCTPTPGAPNLPYVDPGGVLFDRLHPVEIDLTIDAAGLAALELEPREYVAGTFTVTTADGTTSEPLAIGIALKGSVGGSFVDLTGKAAFKLKLDFVVDDGDFLGLRGLKLNNMLEDPSQLREAVAYAVLGELGVPAPRSGHAEVRLNGESYGLHAVVERVDDVWLSRFFPSTLHLYEGTSGLDVTPGREAEFSVDEGDPLDVSDLTALMAVTTLPDDQLLAALDARLHLDAVLRVWAAELLLAHNDGYATAQNNYSLHSDEAGTFDFVPSGFDQSQRFLIDLHGDSSPLDQRGILFQRCIDHPACLERYDAALDDVAHALADFDAQAEIDAIAAAIEPWVQADPRRAESIDEVHAAQDETRTFWIDLAGTLR